MCLLASVVKKMPQTTSTPTRTTAVDLHRQSIINRLSTVIPASPLRKGRTDASLSASDDQNERSKRQQRLDLRKRVSNIQPQPQPPQPQSQSPQPQSSKRRSDASNRFSIFFPDNEAKEHLQNCHKLFSENKITIKNVWNLKVIDVLSQMVRQQKEANLLQIASTSLDVSAKVYGLRVDDVHSFGMRIASHLTETNDNERDRNDLESDKEDGNGNRRNVGRKRKQKVFKLGGKKPTLDYDGTSLFAPLKKLQKPQFNVDDKLESGAIDNLLTLRLPIHPQGHTFRIFNNEKYAITEPDTTIQNQSIVEINLPIWKNSKICPAFDNFIINQNAELFDACFSENEVVFDDNGVPIPELDGSILDPFTTDHDDNITDEGEEMIVDQQREPQQAITDIIDTIPEDEGIENQYNFNTLIKTSNGRIIEKLWAGPAHWKIKFIKRTLLRYSGNSVVNQQIAERENRKKKQKITPMPIVPTLENFSNIRIDISNKYKNRKKSVLEPNTIKKTILPRLPDDVLESLNHHNVLLLKPSVLPSSQRTKSNIEIHVESYDYNNLDDTNYCPANNDDDHSDHNDDNGIIENHNDEQANFENELIDIPETVTVNYLTYALHAKKVNMKKLKSAVWDRLTENNRIDDDDYADKIEPLQFSRLYREIPERLDTNMAKDLSVALLFNSVLYLTNENSLVIKQRQRDVTDFIITK